jgi:hypothetical protein
MITKRLRGKSFTLTMHSPDFVSILMAATLDTLRVSMSRPCSAAPLNFQDLRSRLDPAYRLVADALTGCLKTPIRAADLSDLGVECLPVDGYLRVSVSHRDPQTHTRQGFRLDLMGLDPRPMMMKHITSLRTVGDADDEDRLNPALEL